MLGAAVRRGGDVPNPPLCLSQAVVGGYGVSVGHRGWASLPPVLLAPAPQRDLPIPLKPASVRHFTAHPAIRLSGPVPNRVEKARIAPIVGLLMMNLIV